MAELFDRITAYINALDVDSLGELQRISILKSFKKGELLLRQDEVCSRSFHVQSGIARKYYLNDGKEVTSELFFAQDLAISFDSYSLQQPSREYIEALTDLSVLVTHHQAFQEAKRRFPALITLDLLLTEYYAIWAERRLFEFHTMTATERYKDLLKRSPHVVQSVSLTVIASYLGISLETLSRIRAKHMA